MAFSKNKFSMVFKSGTWAGIIVALVGIILFLLAATYLRSLVFGIILAYFCLPLERFFERKFFQWKPIQWTWDLLCSCILPFLALKKYFSKDKLLTEEQQMQQHRKSLTIRAMGMTLLTLVVIIAAIIAFLRGWMIPRMEQEGKNLLVQVRENAVFVKAERKVEQWGKGTDGKSSNGEESLLIKVRTQIAKYVKENSEKLTQYLFSSGKNILQKVFSMFGKVSRLLLDVLLGFVFFLFFLYQMAVFMNYSQERKSMGEWFIQVVFESKWLPHVSKQAKVEAAEIIDTIIMMLSRWARGYLWIMIIEVILYAIGFSLFGVPCAVLLAIPACMTVLLPCFGIIGNLLLTILTCLLFCPSDVLLGTLIGAMLTFLLVNGVLEQLILYPCLVGGAIGLSLMETIVVVLIGGIIAGVAGMVLAVPMAAVLKFLIPKIYDIAQTEPAALKEK